jgi:phage shock protein E
VSGENDRSTHPSRAYMNFITWLVIAGAVLAFLLVKRLTLVTPAAAREWLNKGALVIDVRSEGEFEERHLPGAINIPLGRLRYEIARCTPDKAQPLLLHCLSGGRSGVGQGMLRQMGYSNVFNLGSYGRAEKIVGTPAEVQKSD